MNPERAPIENEEMDVSEELPTKKLARDSKGNVFEYSTTEEIMRRNEEAIDRDNR